MSESVTINPSEDPTVKVSVSMPESYVRFIDIEAKKERRTRSGYLQRLLERVKETQQQSQPA